MLVIAFSVFVKLCDTFILGEVTVHTTGFDFIYTTYNTKEMSNITFSVKGPNDAHIGLLADVKSQFRGVPFYEIVVGGWQNVRCSLRKIGYNGTPVVKTDVYPVGYLSNQEFRNFWISWKHHVISVGFGAKAGENGIYSYDDKAAPMDINYLAFSSYRYSSHQWKFYNGRFLFRY